MAFRLVIIAGAALFRFMMAAASDDTCPAGKDCLQTSAGVIHEDDASLLQFRGPGQGILHNESDDLGDDVLAWFEDLNAEGKVKWSKRAHQLYKEAATMKDEPHVVESQLFQKYKWANRVWSLVSKKCEASNIHQPSDPVDACTKCTTTSLVNEHNFCLWCPARQSCKAMGLAVGEGGSCSASTIGVNSEGQCWAQKFPYSVGDFLSIRPASARAWVVQSTKHFDEPLLPFPTYSVGKSGMFDLATGRPLHGSREGGAAANVVIAASSDWGGGTGEAAVVASLMEADMPHVSLHLGDVYWVGTRENFDTNVVGVAPNEHQVGVKFPKGKKATFLMNGNHEMISGAEGLFNGGFNYSGQKTTYASYQSDYWRLIPLDTGYLCYGSFPDLFEGLNSRGARNLANETDAPLPEQLVAWLRDVVKIGDPSDTRGIVFFTHHQPYSEWGSAYLGAAKQLNQLLPRHKQVIWFFGHEHRLAFYDELHLTGDKGFRTDFSLFPRMVGNGGFSDFPMNDPNSAHNLRAWDNRTYQEIPQFPFKPMRVGFNGYFKMEVSGPHLKVSYITGKCADSGCHHGYNTSYGSVMAEESYHVCKWSGKVRQKWTKLSSDLAVVPQSLQSEEAPRMSNTRPKFEDSDAALLWALNHRMD